MQGLTSRRANMVDMKRMGSSRERAVAGSRALTSDWNTILCLA